jgi:hypothetical protein
MTTQAHLDAFIAELLAKTPPYPAAAQLSENELSTLAKLLPDYNSIWMPLGSASQTIYTYSRVYHLIQAVTKDRNDTANYLTNNDKARIDEHTLHLIRSVSAFSKEGVVRNYDLEILLLRGLAGEEVDVGRFDRREIVFHGQQLVESGLASGDWSSNGSYVYEFHLKSLTLKGHDLLSKVSHSDFRYGQKPNGKIRILFVSANPHGETQLKLDEEVREIEAKIRAAEYRDSLELITKLAARPDDLLQSLNQHEPHIVHFSGHGSSTEEIILLDKLGNPKPVSKEALVSLFNTLKNNIRVVLLNACFSQPQAEAITEEIDCAIGMMRAIGNDAAITFAAAFYRAIGFGRSVKDAFDQGRTALLLEGIPEEKTPVLMTRKKIAAESIVLVNVR